MEDRLTNGEIDAASWLVSTRDAFPRPSILLVEDDADIRELLTTLLQLAGYCPKGCESAEAGLECLREHEFDLLLTDYMLPKRTGGWLIQQAEAEGLLAATPALLVTAHPSPDQIDGIEVIPKPFDLDELVERIRKKLEESRGPKSHRASRPGPRRSSSSDDDGCPDPIELILYVSAQSPHSTTALENIRNVLRRYKSSRVKLTIHDLSDPNQGAADRIAFTPTLVKKSPGPRTLILGHITNPDLLLELLESCEES